MTQQDEFREYKLLIMDTLKRFEKLIDEQKDMGDAHDLAISLLKEDLANLKEDFRMRMESLEQSGRKNTAAVSRIDYDVKTLTLKSGIKWKVVAKWLPLIGPIVGGTAWWLLKVFAK
jgi:hypothetical protein